MKPSERRAAMKAEMAQRLQESYNSKDDSGKFKSIFIKSALGNTPKWKCSEDEHFINIIPFMAGKHHPTVSEGKMAVNLDIWVHNKVGINEDSYVCMQRSFGKACPICEEQNEIRKQDNYDEKLVKSMNPSRRVVYNIQVLDNDKEIKKGIQVWDVSHFLFEKELSEIAKKPRGGGFILYADPDEGKSIFFRKSGNGPTNTKYAAFKFEDRDEPISDELLDSALCLDSLIHIPTYDEVANAFYGRDSGDEEEESEIEERNQEAAVNARRPAPKFKCPGTRPTDFGSFEECDDCPDVEACEVEYAEESEAEAVAAAEAEREAQKPAETERRSLRRSNPEPEPERQVDPEAGEGRRIRRRPGA